MDINDFKSLVETSAVTPFVGGCEREVFARNVAMTAFENPDDSSLLGLISRKLDSDAIMERLGKLAFVALSEDDYDARSFLLFATFCSPSRATLLSKYVKQIVSAPESTDWYALISYLLCTQISKKQDVIKFIKKILSKNPQLILKLTKFM